MTTLSKTQFQGRALDYSHSPDAQAVSAALMSGNMDGSSPDDIQHLQGLQHEAGSGVEALRYLTGLRRQQEHTFYDDHPVVATGLDAMSYAPAAGVLAGAGQVGKMLYDRHRTAATMERVRKHQEGAPGAKGQAAKPSFVPNEPPAAYNPVKFDSSENADAFQQILRDHAHSPEFQQHLNGLDSEAARQVRSKVEGNLAAYDMSRSARDQALHGFDEIAKNHAPSVQADMDYSLNELSSKTQALHNLKDRLNAAEHERLINSTYVNYPKDKSDVQARKAYQEMLVRRRTFDKRHGDPKEMKRLMELQSYEHGRATSNRDNQKSNLDATQKALDAHKATAASSGHNLASLSGDMYNELQGSSLTHDGRGVIPDVNLLNERERIMQEQMQRKSRQLGETYHAGSFADKAKKDPTLRNHPQAKFLEEYLKQYNEHDKHFNAHRETISHSKVPQFAPQEHKHRTGSAHAFTTADFHPDDIDAIHKAIDSRNAERQAYESETNFGKKMLKNPKLKDLAPYAKAMGTPVAQGVATYGLGKGLEWLQRKYYGPEQTAKYENAARRAAGDFNYDE